MRPIIKRPGNQLTPFEFLQLAEADDMVLMAGEQLKVLEQQKEQIKDGFVRLIDKIQVPVSPITPPTLPEEEEEYPILNYAYPASGRKRVGAGTVIIRFHEGSVELPDGTVEKITGTTAKLPFDFMCRSVGIEIDTAVDILLADEMTRGILSEKLRRTLSPVRTVYRKVEFDYLELTTSRATNLYIEASSHEEGVPRMELARGEELKILPTDKDLHFTGEIKMNNHETENLTGLLSSKVWINGVHCQSKQALKFLLLFWSKDTFADTDLDLDSNKNMVELDMSSSPAYRIAKAHQYYLPVDDLAIPYEDEDGTNELHISLMNLSAVAKEEGTDGQVQIDVYYSPRL